MPVCLLHGTVTIRLEWTPEAGFHSTSSRTEAGHRKDLS
jgi:hypothetical protein